MADKHIIGRRDLLKMTGAGVASLTIPTLVLAKSPDDFIDLRASKVQKKFAGDDSAPSDLWLYNGTTPGPEIRVKRGETVRVRFTNELDEPTSIHWHGIRITNNMDGVSGLTQEPIKPGETFEYVFDVPDAGTFWYHAHNKSWEQVARGLYGPLIVEEEQPVFNHVHDITLVIDDWRLNDQGAFDAESLGFLGDWSHAGRLGGWLTVNGQSQPSIKLSRGEAYRLRLINASNARILFIDPNAIDAWIIAYDGFPLPQPRKSEQAYEPLLPAQRVDLLVVPKEKSEKRLNNEDDYALMAFAGREPMSIAIFNIVDGPDDSVSSSPRLPMNEIERPHLASAKSVTLDMAGGAMGRMGQMMHNGTRMRSGDFERTGQFWSFNGTANIAEEPLFRATNGETVVVSTINNTGWPHGIHLHGHHFQIIEHNGQTPTHMDWRDTFTIDRDESVKIAFVADNPGKWLLHCHMLEHAAAGMNTWFEVT